MGTIWFEDSIEINGSIKDVKKSMERIDEHYTELIKLMPGITRAQLLEKRNDFVVIKTNEGVLKRTNITKRMDDKFIIVKLDEFYKTGRGIDVESHIVEKYSSSDVGINYHITISDVQASGLLGFFYRVFGSKNIGNAFLDSNKKFFNK